MAALKFSKKTALPVSPTPDTVYFIKSGTTVKIYITDNAGNAILISGGASATSTTGIPHPFLLMGAGGG